MSEQTNKPIRCHVVRVDKDATSCQEPGNTFMVDDGLEGKLCPAAKALVEAAAGEMNGAPDGSPEAALLDVPCPDDYVTYRLTRTDGDGDGP